MTIVVGINAYHADSSACLIKDGRLVAAVEEERFNRVKHWAGLPVNAVRSCLGQCGIGFDEIDIIALNSNPRANFGRRLLHTAFHRPGWTLIKDRLRSRRYRRSIADALARACGRNEFRGSVYRVEHHLAHLAAAFFSSPFERAGVVSVDGFGDFASTAWGTGDDRTIEVKGRVHFPHSLGIFYETITHFLGFTRYGDEYKVMGLAPYGVDRFRAQMQQLISLRAGGSYELGLKYFSHHKGHSVMSWEDCEPVTADGYSHAITELLGPPRAPMDEITQRHKDIARSAQAMYERALFHILIETHAVCGSDALVLGGGCAFNSAANGRIFSNTPFSKLFIQPAAGDAGGALGAALHAWNVHLEKPRKFVMTHAYWGPEFSEEAIMESLERRSDELSSSLCSWESVEFRELVKRVARELADGRVIGWFQGRMEWGPRALGNRSILADPRRTDIREILNTKIKNRERFRPFAPAILKEHVAEWFGIDDDAPFMLKVLAVRESQRRRVPAVVHVDGSSRIQTVDKERNPIFCLLLEEFYSLTGVPLLLNTSFNENEPIVCTPIEAIDCFLRTRMDGIALGNQLLMRPKKEPVDLPHLAAADPMSHADS